MSRLHTNGALIEWALSDAGVTIAEAADLTGRTSIEVQKWITSDEYPHKGDLKKLAGRVGRSMQFFFLPAPPDQPDAAIKFRKSTEDESRDPATELKAIRLANSAQKLARWAAESSDVPPVDFPTVTADPVRYAEKMREHLKWSTRDQVKATSKSAVFKALRTRVENLGTVVLFLAAGAENCRGFSLPDPIAPTVVLNSAYRLNSLKSYTLLHEMGHLARNTAAICHDEDTEEERWCNSFAAAFLIPEEHLRAYFEFKHWSWVDEREIEEKIRLTSNRYKASWHAVAIRLRDLGLTSQQVVDTIARSSKEKDGGFSADGGRTRPLIRLDEFGSTYTRAVLNLRRTDQISEFDARQKLRVSGHELSTLNLIVGNPPLAKKSRENNGDIR